MPDLLKSEEPLKSEFIARPWKYPGKMSWHFVSLPPELATEIRGFLKWQEEGWGRLKATAKIGNSEWKTAIWFDTKLETYLLPLKAEIRRNEKLEIDKDVKIIIWFQGIEIS